MGRRFAILIGVAAVGVMALGAQTGAAALPGQPVFVGPFGPFFANSGRVSISADGRYVAFESNADNLSGDDDDSVTNVFVRDLGTNTTTLVNYGIGGAGADDHSTFPSISADGRYVSFKSGADNLSGDDDNSFTNVFVRDLEMNTTTLVSRGITGADGASGIPSISADGRYVAFDSAADNLSADDLNSVVDVFVRDTAMGTTTLVNYGIGGAGADNHSGSPSISADGRYVAFASDADNLSADDDNSVTNVFVRDTAMSTTTLVNYGIGGAGADDRSGSPSISADGRYVAFDSDADNLSGDDDNSVLNVFVRDTAMSTTTLVNYGIGGAGADDHSAFPSISADGRSVAFASEADNLSAGDNNAVRNVFVRDLEANTTTLVSRAGGTPADGLSFDPSISADGRYVAFQSFADNLSAADDNSLINFFRQDLVGDPGFGPRTQVTLRLAARRIPARGPLKVRVANANGFAVTGKLSGQTTRPVSVSRRRRVKLKAKAFSVGSNAKKIVKLRLPVPLRGLLKRTGRLNLRLVAGVRDPAGNTRTVTKRVTPLPKRRRR